MPKVIGIIGSRRRNTPEDYQAVERWFVEIYKPGDKICSGGCPKGADAFAETIAEKFHVPIVIHPPAEVPKGSPRWAYTQANYARNTLVAKDSDVIIACVSADRKGGTEDTLKKYLKFHPNPAVYIV